MCEGPDADSLSVLCKKSDEDAQSLKPITAEWLSLMRLGK